MVLMVPVILVQEFFIFVETIESIIQIVPFFSLFFFFFCSLLLLISDLVSTGELTESLEHCPKWKALSEILEEISQEEEECKKAVKEEKNVESTDDGTRIKIPPSVLICAEDDRTCSQLKEV